MSEKLYLCLLKSCSEGGERRRLDDGDGDVCKVGVSVIRDCVDK